MKFTQDKELKNLADAIIEEHRPNLRMLSICFLFRDVATVTDGKTIVGRCVRVDDRNWSVHKKDVIIEIGKDIWDEASPDFQKAIMDHELGHIGLELDEDGTVVMDEKTLRIKIRLHRHDIEEFEDVLARHGAYHKDLRSFLNTWAQRQMDKKKKAPVVVSESEELE